MSDSTTTTAPEATTQPSVEERLASIQARLDRRSTGFWAGVKSNGKVITCVVLVLAGLVFALGYLFFNKNGAHVTTTNSSETDFVALRNELESTKAQLAKLAATAEAKAKADAEATAEAAKKAEADALRQEMSSLKDEFMAAIAAATTSSKASVSNATAQLEPETPTTTGGVKTLTDQLTPEQAVQLMGAAGSEPKVMVANKEQAPNGDIMINTLQPQGDVWLPNVTEGRSVSVDYKPEDIGQEIPIGYFRFAPQALEIYQQHGLRAVISNTRVGSGKLLVVFTK